MTVDAAIVASGVAVIAFVHAVPVGAILSMLRESPIEWLARISAIIHTMHRTLDDFIQECIQGRKPCMVLYKNPYKARKRV